ncbi:hypothetical protein ACVQ8P_06895 [Dellaglioa sp. BT-FLS60]
MRKKLFLPMLNLFSNIDTMLPYLIFYSIYAFQSRTSAFLIPLAILYTFRGVGMFLTPFFSMSHYQMILFSTIFNCFGFFLGGLNPSNVTMLGISGLFLGIGSSWSWPFFLSIKERDSIKLKKMDWLSSLIFFIFVGGLLYYANTNGYYQILFFVLAILNLFLALNLKLLLSENISAAPDVKKPNKKILIGYLFFVFIASLFFFTAKFIRAEFINRSGEMLIFASILIFLIAIIYILLKNKLFRENYLAINRGVMLNYVLLYAPFFSMTYFHLNAIIPIYIIYIIGFELGMMTTGKWADYRKYVLIIALCLTFTQVSFYLGILLIAYYIGLENQLVNESFRKIQFQNNQAFVLKYQLSGIGNLLQQLFYMLLVIGFSIVAKTSLVTFFSSSAITNQHLLAGIYLIHTIVTVNIIFWAIICDKK